MKAFLVWTLSFLLAWEPFAFSASKTFDSDMKNYLETTHLTQKRLTLREFYNANATRFPKELREALKPMLEKMGSYVLPKFDVTKVKGPEGEAAYRFSAQQDGKSVSFVVFNGGDKMDIRVNGQSIAKSDHLTLAQYFEKFGMTQPQATETLGQRQPASTLRGVLSAQQIQRMNKSMQRQYFQQLRGLMESIEAAQNAFGYGKGKTSSTLTIKADKYAVLFALLNPEASAQTGPDSGASCVAGGYVTTVGWNSGRINPQTGKVEPGWSCGSDGHGGVASEMRGRCAAGEFLCNPVLYGSGQSNCSPVGADTTKFCNHVVSGSDIPDLSKNRAEFNQLKTKAENQAQMLLSKCASNHFSAGQLNSDQQWTCHNLQDRYSTIESWSCANTSFAQKYQKLCADAVFNPPTVTPPPVVQQPPAATQPPQLPTKDPQGNWYCDSLPGDMKLGPIDNSACPNHQQINRTQCMDRKGTAQDAYQCVCYDGEVANGFKCSPHQDTADNSGVSHHRRQRTPPPQAKGPNWWIIAGAALAGLGLFYWIDKSTMKSNFDYMSSVYTATSTTTVTTLPTPRSDPGVR
jgi:hypothetical protein